jgi:hypothetical protein
VGGWRCEKFVEMGISRNVRHVVGLEMWAESSGRSRGWEIRFSAGL